MALAPIGEIDDFHSCAIVWADGSGTSWCVLSSGENSLYGTLPDSCEAAGAGGWGPVARTSPPGYRDDKGALAWGVQARRRRVRHLAGAEGPSDGRSRSGPGPGRPVLRLVRHATIRGGHRSRPACDPRPHQGCPPRRKLYERRLAFIDEGLSAWQHGEERAHFRASTAPRRSRFRFRASSRRSGRAPANRRSRRLLDLCPSVRRLQVFQLRARGAPCAFSSPLTSTAPRPAGGSS
jgi:hypothetical protein